MNDNDLMLLADNAKELIVGTLLPLLVLWLTSLNWKAEHKFAAAAGASLVAGLVVAYSDGLLTVESVAQNFVTILSTSQTIYFTFFKALGLERWIYPPAAVVDEAQQQVKDQLVGLSRDEAKTILDPAVPTDVTVEVKKVNTDQKA